MEKKSIELFLFLIIIILFIKQVQSQVIVSNIDSVKINMISILSQDDHFDLNENIFINDLINDTVYCDTIKVYNFENIYSFYTLNSSGFIHILIIKNSIFYIINMDNDFDKIMKEFNSIPDLSSDFVFFVIAIIKNTFTINKERTRYSVPVDTFFINEQKE